MSTHADLFAGADVPLLVAATGGGVAVPDTYGTVVAVVSAAGGCGRTFLATNLAYRLASHGARTCLLDLDLQFGEASASLRLAPPRTIGDLLDPDAATDPAAVDRRLDEHLAVHESGLRVLAAPDDPSAAARIDAGAMADVVEAARRRFDYVVLDTPAGMGEAVLVGLDHADHVLAMATLDVPSMRNLAVMLATVDRLGVPPERVHLVLNKVERGVGLDVAGLRRCFPQGFSMVVPYGREVSRCLNQGRPLLAGEPASEVGRALASGMAGLGLGPGRPWSRARPRRRRFHRAAVAAV